MASQGNAAAGRQGRHESADIQVAGATNTAFQDLPVTKAWRFDFDARIRDPAAERGADVKLKEGSYRARPELRQDEAAGVTMDRYCLHRVRAEGRNAALSRIVVQVPTIVAMPPRQQEPRHQGATDQQGTDPNHEVAITRCDRTPGIGAARRGSRPVPSPFAGRPSPKPAGQPSLDLDQATHQARAQLRTRVE